MAISNEVSALPATQGQVAGIAIQATVALRHLVVALTKLRSDPSASIASEIDVISDTADRLSRIFDDLAGWTD